MLVVDGWQVEDRAELAGRLNRLGQRERAEQRDDDPVEEAQGDAVAWPAHEPRLVALHGDVVNVRKRDRDDVPSAPEQAALDAHDPFRTAHGHHLALVQQLRREPDQRDQLRVSTTTTMLEQGARGRRDGDEDEDKGED